MKLIKRWLKIALGFCIVVIGIILMPIPGPGGAPVTLVGLVILATELSFVRRLLERFAALRVKYYEKHSPRKRWVFMGVAIIACVVMTTVTWWVFVSGKL